MDFQISHPMKKLDWTHHFIELFVVFIGITAAFLLNSWRERMNEKQLALKYYGSLMKDLTVDADDFEELLPFVEHQDSILLNFLSNANAENPDEAAITDLLQVLVSYTQFTAETATFETIKFSGNLDVFSDYELREEINSYYNKVDEVMLKQSLHYDYMNNYCIPFIYNNVDILSGKLLPEAELGTKFTNVAVGFQTLLRQNIGAYRELMDENMSLKLRLAQKFTN
jgi:hypothetical protein